jgi:hypothetical protein
MVARLDLDSKELWEKYERLGSLRAVSRETGIGHMVIRNHLERAGYKLKARQENPQSLQPTSKVYLRPAHIEALTELTKKRGVSSIHAMARELLNGALKRELPQWEIPYD